MNRISARVTSMLFVGALVLLLLTALAAFRNTARYAESERWLARTHEAVTHISAIRAQIYAADAARLQYILSNDPAALSRFREVSEEIPSALTAIEKLTEDNPTQLARVRRLRSLLDHHIGVLAESTSLTSTEHSDAPQATLASGALEKQIFDLLDDFRVEETSLLAQRQIVSQASYVGVQMMLVVAFLAALIIVTVMFRLTLRELRERQLAEGAVRQLSQRLLRVQDEERRKMARELHDGVGQFFVALKFNLSAIATDQHSPRVQNLLSECINLVDQGVTESRTLSYLLHPPLLEELGFTSAARWYVDGFAQRSQIRVTLNITEDLDRVDPNIELALFRILQEALTNIHRHSGSSSADIRVEKNAGNIVLIVQDYGKGIPAERLEQFRKTGTGMGVGLAGMQERLRDLHGALQIESEGSGTLLRVTMPITAPTEPREISSQPPAQPERVNAEPLSPSPEEAAETSSASAPSPCESIEKKTAAGTFASGRNSITDSLPN